MNFVAHSHGGNVVLEAIRHLTPNVRVGRIALLGTPLITTRPAFSAARFVFSAVLIASPFFGVVAFDILTEDILTGDADAAQLSLSLVVISVPLLILYSWMFWLGGNLLDAAWRFICRCLEPLAWLRRKDRLLVYGPASSKLKNILRGRPILLLTTYNDEADALLQVGSNPGRLYGESVATRFSSFDVFSNSCF